MKDFIKEQFENVIPQGWIVERVIKLPMFDNFDYSIRFFNNNLEHQIDIFINVTEQGYVERIHNLNAILKESTKNICDTFAGAL